MPLCPCTQAEPTSGSAGGLRGSGDESAWMPIRLASRAMGTRFELVLAGRSRAHLVAAGEEALLEIEEWDRRLSRFRSASCVSHLAARCASEPVRLDVDLFELLAECLAVHADSGGAFDVTLGARMEALGFARAGAPAGAPVDERTARDPSRGSDLSRMSALVLDPEQRTLRFRTPGVALDLGAIGKGHALDRAAELLRAADVPCALLHGGTSSVVAIGAPPGEAAWRVELRVPGGAAWIVELRDAALGVSAPHGRTAGGDPARTHVLDPRTGEPSRAALLAALVGPSARTADAWSTALVAGGSRRTPPGYAVLVATERDAGVHVEVTGDETQRVRLAATGAVRREAARDRLLSSTPRPTPS